MAILTEKQIQYGFSYFHSDEPQKKRIVEVKEYNGEPEIVVHCTQLGDSFTPQYQSQKEKKRVLYEWCEFLSAHPAEFKSIEFCTRMPQELFDAVCCQTNLEQLYIKWGVYKDISSIANLRKLKYLHIGSGAGVEDLTPISTLKSLAALYIENFQKINDYSCLAELRGLESLAIMGDGMSPKFIHVDTLSFLYDMPQLRFFCFLTARLKDKDFMPLLSLKALEHLTVVKDKEIRRLYSDILKLPKLRYGSVIENPEYYGYDHSQLT